MKIPDVKKLIVRTFKNHQLSSIHSNICANAIINAELVGAPSHGLARISSYCNRIKKKVLTTNALSLIITLNSS